MSKSSKLKQILVEMRNKYFFIALLMASVAFYMVWVFVGILMAFGVFEWLNPEDFVKGLWISVTLGTPIIAFISLLASPFDYHTIRAVNAKNGNGGTWQLGSKMWSDLDCVWKFNTEEGRTVEKEVSKDWMIPIHLNELGAAFEVEKYDPVTNTAYVTYLGKSRSLNSSEIRYIENIVPYLLEELSRQVDEADRKRALIRPTVEDSVRDLANYQIHTLEGAEVPQGDIIEDTVNRNIRKHGLNPEDDEDDNEKEVPEHVKDRVSLKEDSNLNEFENTLKGGDGE